MSAPATLQTLVFDVNNPPTTGAPLGLSDPTTGVVAESTASLPLAGGTMAVDAHIVFSAGAKLDDHDENASVEPDTRVLKHAGNTMLDWSGDKVELTRGAAIPSGKTVDFANGTVVRANPDGTGIDQVCSAAIVHRWREGRLWFLADGLPGVVSLIRSTFDETPGAGFDSTQDVVVGTVFENLKGIRWTCVANTATAAEWAKVDNFRALSDGNIVNYNDAAIRYNGPDQWVQLPEVADARVGKIIDFFGYDSSGYTNGFYTNDGNTVLPPSGAARNWFSVPSRARVRIQLGDDLLWRVTVLDAGIVNFPFCSGSTTLNLTDGSRFYFGYLNDTAAFGVSGGVDMDTVECAVGWTQGTPRLDFDSSVKLPNGVSSLLPVDLEVWRSYSFECIKRGGYWALKGPVQGPTLETED